MNQTHLNWPRRFALLLVVIALLAPLGVASAAGELASPAAGGDTIREAPAQAGPVTAVVRANLRMRSGPGTAYGATGVVPYGTVVPVVSRDATSRWVQVEYNGARGWVAAWYTRINGSLAAVPVGDGAQPQQPAAPAPAGENAELLARLNQTRCQNGLQPVAANAQLDAAALAHTQDMVANNFFSHTGSNGSTLVDRVRAQGYAFTYVGENLAAGNSVAGATFDQWWNSQGHRDNMMNGAFTEVGLAHIAQPGTTYGHYWAMVLGNRAGAAAPTCAQLGY